MLKASQHPQSYSSLLSMAQLSRATSEPERCKQKLGFQTCSEGLTKCLRPWLQKMPYFAGACLPAAFEELSTAGHQKAAT